MSDTPRTDKLVFKGINRDKELREHAQTLEREVAELLQRLQERTESHIHASARDVQTIQQQAVEISNYKRQITQAFSWYVGASEIACNLISDVKTALSSGMSHGRSKLELATTRHTAALKKLTAEEAPNIKTDVRLFDLVRYMRTELHEANLITDAEYTWLLTANPGETDTHGSPSRNRLETYDELREEITQLKQQLAST